jgi:hypothetical protein
MSLKFLLAMAFAGFCTVGTVFAAPGNCANPVSAWMIKQTSYNLGDVDMVLAKDAFKWHNNKLGLTLIMHAPDWKLNAFNEANKKYLILNKAEALEIFQHQRRRENSGFETPIKLGDRPAVAGMPTVAYCYAHDTETISEKFALSVTNALENGSKLNHEQKDYIDHALNHQRREYWYAKQIQFPAKVSGVFLEKIAAIKYGDNLPLRLIQIGKDGVRTTMFDTTEVRKAMVPADFSKMPKGYTKAENKVALLVNDVDFAGFAGESEPNPVSTKPVVKKNDDTHR